MYFYTYITTKLRLLWIWSKSVSHVKKYVFDLMISHGTTTQSEDFPEKGTE